MRVCRVCVSMGIREHYKKKNIIILYRLLSCVVKNNDNIILLLVNVSVFINITIIHS